MDSTSQTLNPATHRKGILLLLGASLCAGSLAISGKMGLNSNAGVLTLLLTRTALGTSLMWIFLIFWRPGPLMLDRRGFGRCCELAAVMLLSMTLYVLSLDAQDVSISFVILTGLYIPIVILITSAWGQSSSYIDWLRFSLAMVGIFLFVQPSGNATTLGVLLASANAVTYAAYTTLFERRLAGYPAITAITWSMSIITVFFIVVHFLVGNTLPPISDSGTWLSLLWFGLIGTGVTRIFLFTGIQAAGSRQAALFSPLELVITLFLAVILLGEGISMVQWVGTATIIISIMLANVKMKQRKEAIA